jgi:hypothetical protein
VVKFERAVSFSIEVVRFRDGVKDLLGDKYESSVAPYRAVLRGLAEQRKQSLADVARSLASEMRNAGHDCSLVFAAFVNEVEAGGAR